MITEKFAEPCYSNPWLLDLEEKVIWANEHSDRKWKLGEHCWLRPTNRQTFYPTEYSDKN